MALGAHHTGQSPWPVAVEQIVVHPDFNHDDFTHDIGFLKLLKPVNLDWAVNVVCMPPFPGFAHPGRAALVAGWGRTVPEEDDEQTTWEGIRFNYVE